jgi:hypothetical protein
VRKRARERERERERKRKRERETRKEEGNSFSLLFFLLVGFGIVFSIRCGTLCLEV